MTIDALPPSFGLVAQWLGLLSVATFLVSLLLIPLLVARIPTDYFLTHEGRVQQRHARHPLLAFITRILRNGLGGLLCLAGVLMLFLPGQGLLTILIGISLLDVPGKKRMLHQLIRRPSLQRALNWLRRKTGHQPFQFPQE